MAKYTSKKPDDVFTVLQRKLPKDSVPHVDAGNGVMLDPAPQHQFTRRALVGAGYRLTAGDGVLSSRPSSTPPTSTTNSPAQPSIIDMLSPGQRRTSSPSSRTRRAGASDPSDCHSARASNDPPSSSPSPVADTTCFCGLPAPCVSTIAHDIGFDVESQSCIAPRVMTWAANEMADAQLSPTPYHCNPPVPLPVATSRLLAIKYRLTKELLQPGYHLQPREQVAADMVAVACPLPGTYEAGAQR